MKFPTAPARNAAAKLVDFETSTGLNNEFLHGLVQDASSEAEATKIIGEYIDRETGLPDLLKALEWLLYGCLTDSEVTHLAKGETHPTKVANRAKETKEAREFAKKILEKVKG